MNDILQSCSYFGVVLCFSTYLLGVAINKRVKNPLANPLLIATFLMILILTVLKIDYDTYKISANYVSYFMTPATVCLAIPLYRQLETLKKNAAAILTSIVAGCLAMAVSLFVFCKIFGLDAFIYHSLQAKSVTTGIAVSITNELGGDPSIVIFAVVISGLLGAIIGKTICRIFRIVEPVAKGLAMGNSAHAAGTAAAFEMGEVEGAISGLSIAIAGVLTVIVTSLFSGLIV